MKGFDHVHSDERAARHRIGGTDEDVAAPQFFTSLVDTVLGVTPVQHHVEVRRRRHRRDIPVAEADPLW